jgi:hypothetical protein
MATRKFWEQATDFCRIMFSESATVSKVGTDPFPAMNASIGETDSFWGWRWAAALLLMSNLSSSANSENYIIKGRVSRTIHASDIGKGDMNDTYDFDLMVIGCLWKIRVARTGGPFDYLEAGTDGTNVFTLLNMETEVARQNSEGEQTGANIAIGTILPGNIPLEADSFAIPVLWLAYASGCYFETNRTSQIPTIFPTGLKNPYTFSAMWAATWSLQASSPSLPVDLVCYHDGSVDWWENPTLGPWTKAPTRAELPPPYSIGYTNFVYQTLAVTNLDGLDVPLQFRIIRFVPNSEGGSNGALRVNVSIEGRLTYAEMVQHPPSTLPDIPGKTLSADYRFALSAEHVLGSIEYLFDDHWWSDKEVRAAPEYREKLNSGNRAIRTAGLAKVRNEPMPSHSGRLLIMSALAGCLILPIGWMIQNALNNKKKGRRE